MPEPATHRPLSRRLHSVLCGAILCLFASRFFLVAESAAQGDTLWLVAGWIAGLVILVLNQGRHFAIRVGWLDASVLCLVSGHCLSAFVVILQGGDRRTAANLGWEWAGIGVTWIVLKQLTRGELFRRHLLGLTVACTAAISLVGLYQHYIDFPQMAVKYGGLIDRLKHADPAEASVIRRELALQQIPSQGPALILFEKRLRDSREPLAFFALANTLGGILAVGVIVALAIGIASDRTQRTPALGAVWSWLLASLGWCLLLTKSRTAWIGTIAGISVFGFAGRGRPARAMRWPIAVAGLVLIAGVCTVLVRWGGLDRQVITEAPKSLQYRLQYWSATLPMVLDHPWFGVGLGQFRHAYLLYKHREASEEIADPHNLFLDTAANGGVVALVGLAALLLLLAARLTALQVAGPASASSHDEMGPQSPADAITLMTIAGMTGCLCIILLFLGTDDRLLAVLPVALALDWWLVQLLCRNRFYWNPLQRGALAAAVALITHLLGAGGIEMPMVVILLLALTVLCHAGSSDGNEFSVHPPYASGVILVGCGLLLMGFYWTALRPVTIAQEQLQAGDADVEAGRLPVADERYALAAQADPWSAIPWIRRAELAYQRFEAGRFRPNEWFEKAVGFMQEAITRDPLNFQEHRRLGQWWMIHWQMTREPSDAVAAVEELQQARGCYPTSSALMAELAVALDAAGMHEAAIEMSRKALDQDVVNRQWGHEDRFLADPLRLQMEALSK